MKIIKYCMLLVYASLLQGCCNPWLTYDSKKFYKNIEKYSKESNSENLYLYSYTGLDDFYFSRLNLSFVYNPKGLIGVSVDKARKESINLYLKTIARLYTDESFKDYDVKKMKGIDLCTYFGNELDPEYKSEEPNEISKTLILSNGAIWYFTSKVPLVIKNETITAAIRILKDQNEIDHPEYLEYLKGLPVQPR